MRKTLTLVFLAFVLVACDKHDPVLPGVRVDVFDTGAPRVLNTTIKTLPERAYAQKAEKCPYTQKSDNTIWDGNRKVFSGLATNTFVDIARSPLCAGGYVYAGLSTGELVKINPKNRSIMWIADIYRQSNMMGGASVLDIIAPAVVYSGYVYAGGLGGAFCKISNESGNQQWCTNIGTAHPFIIAGDAAFVVDTDDNLDAIRLRDGAIYWQTAVKKSVAPEYADKIIRVGTETFDATNGAPIKD